MRVIPNQPWYFGDRPETQGCKKSEDACNKIANGDDIYLQFQVDPCAGPILCDQDFASALGNLVSNGDFNGSVSGWTLGATWTYAGGKVTTNDTVSSSLTQAIGVGLNAGECYVLVFTVSDYVAGTLSPILGGTGGTNVTANGTYRQVIIPTAGNNLVFSASGNPNEFSIDNIQLFSMGVCWCPDNGNLFSTEELPGLLCHIPGAETTITQVGVTPPIVINNFYKVVITISDSSAGSVHVIVGASAVSTNFSGNGTFTDYVQADGNNNFEIVMSADFDGCITDVLVSEMTPGINVGVVDLDGNLMQDLSAYAVPYDDRFILKINTSQFTFDYGCYRLFYLDPCDMAPVEILSNCFTWKSEWPGTKLIKAIDRDTTDPSPRYSYGLRWDSTNFYLVQRVECGFRKPVIDTKSNTDRFSTGRHFRSYAEKSKLWEFYIIGLDETQHDCMDTMWGCKIVTVDGIEYFADYDEYQPLWDEKGFNTVADVKFNVSKRDDVIFSDNCNR